MQIIFHRPNQIGGCITEISTEGAKVIIDLGANLPGSESEELTKEQVESITDGADGVYYTHYHGDHIGLAHLVPLNVPQFLGEGAKEVNLVKAYKLRSKKCEQYEAAKRMQTYTANQRIDVGNKGKIFITPYYVSHSAFDAYMFLIEVEGKRILHTGDLRGHGYLSKGLIPNIDKRIGQVDLLIIEGTMLGRCDETVKRESDLKKEVSELLKQKKYLFALCSSTDMERLATLYAACKDNNAWFVIDKYQHEVLEVFKKRTTSNLFHFESNIFNLKDCSQFSDKQIKGLLAKGFIMPLRSHQIAHINELQEVFPKAELIYSMWKGYIEGKEQQLNKEYLNLIERFGGHYHYIHTSGHATLETIQQVCEHTNPRLGIIPIHKDASTDFASLPFAKDYNIITQDCDLAGIHIVYG